MDISSLGSLKKLKASRPYQELFLTHAKERCLDLNKSDWPDVLEQIQITGLQFVIWEISKAVQGILRDFSEEIQEISLEWTSSGSVRMDFDLPKEELKEKLSHANRIRDFFEWNHFIEEILTPTLKNDENRQLINSLFQKVNHNNANKAIDDFVSVLNVKIEKVWLDVNMNPSVIPSKTVRL